MLAIGMARIGIMDSFTAVAMEINDITSFRGINA